MSLSPLVLSLITAALIGGTGLGVTGAKFYIDTGDEKAVIDHPTFITATGLKEVLDEDRAQELRAQIRIFEYDVRQGIASERDKYILEGLYQELEEIQPE